MNIENKLITSSKYAKAFINIFKDQMDLKDLNKLEALKDYLEKNREIFVYFNISLIDESIKIEAFNKLLNLFDLNIIYSNISNLLIKNNRISLIIYILKDIINIYKEINNIIEFNLITSNKLSQDRIDLIENFLKNKTGKKIILKEKIDKSLIAGIKIYSQELEWQFSVRNNLNALKNIKI